jgi:hypothetical protein
MYPVCYDKIIVYGLCKSYEPKERLDNKENKWFGTFSMWDIRKNKSPTRIRNIKMKENDEYTRSNHHVWLAEIDIDQ